MVAVRRPSGSSAPDELSMSVMRARNGGTDSKSSTRLATSGLSDLGGLDGLCRAGGFMVAVYADAAVCSNTQGFGEAEGGAP